MSASGHSRPTTTMDNLSTLYEGSHNSGINSEDYNNSSYFATTQNQNAAFDPNWAINSGHVPSRSQSQSTDPAWQQHQFQQHVQQQQQHQNLHALYRQQSDIYATPFNGNTLNYNDPALNPQPIDNSFPFDPALGSAEPDQGSNPNSTQSPYHSVQNATISPHALQVTRDAGMPVVVDAQEQQVSHLNSQPSFFSTL